MIMYTSTHLRHVPVQSSLSFKSLLSFKFFFTYFFLMVVGANSGFAHTGQVIYPLLSCLNSVLSNPHLFSNCMSE